MAENSRISRRSEKSTDSKIPRRSSRTAAKPETGKSGKLQKANTRAPSKRQEPVSPKRPSQRTSPAKASSRKSGRRPSKKNIPAEPKKKLTREERQIENENKTSKKIIIFASIFVVLLIGLIVGQMLLMNSRVTAVKTIDANLALDITSYFEKEPIKNIATSGSSAISRLVSELRQEVEKESGSDSIKANLLGAIAYTYFSNQKKITTSKGLPNVAALANSTNEGLKKIAIQALGYIPRGTDELHLLLKSTEIDAKTSMIALMALPKTGGGIKGDVLVVALKKKDPEFLKLIFPLVQENIESFKEEPEAVRTLLRLTGHPDDEIKNLSISLLSRCIYKEEHFKQLQNDALSEDLAVQKAALETLLSIDAGKAAKHWGELLSNSRDKQTQLQLITKLGNPACNTESHAIIPFLDGTDEELILEAVTALGKMENPPDNNGIQKIKGFIHHPNANISKAAIISVGQFKYLKPFRYDNPTEMFPYEELIISLGKNTDNEAKNQAIISLEKISSKKFITDERWVLWWKEEKEVIDKLSEIGKLHADIKKLFDNKKYKEAKEALHQLEDIFNSLREKHTAHWAGFGAYLELKGNDFNYLKSAVYKHSPVN